MKRLIFVLAVIALLVPMATAFADDCVNGGCPDTTFIGQCVGWTKLQVTAVANALGINVNLAGTVGPLYNTSSRLDPTSTAFLKATLDGDYACTGSCGYGTVSHTGTEFYTGTIGPSNPVVAIPYSVDVFVPTDTSLPHTIEALAGQNGCVNCPRMGNAKVAPYIPPPPPPEECVDHPMYQMATFEFPSGKTGTLVSWDGYPANVSRQLCHFGEVATNMPVFEWVYKDSCTGAITYNGETYPYYDPEMEKPHWHNGACANVGGCG
jgi:hypothetical protein